MAIIRKSKVIRGTGIFVFVKHIMEYTPVTPFRRTIDAVLLKHQQTANRDMPENGVNKWEALRELSAARVAFGLTDRDMTVLQALISFYPSPVLGGPDGGNLVIHPSNRAICERLNGMPCSTMRRRISNLVQAGLLIRRDSPNGKRYARRCAGEKIAYGFDLSPLVFRFREFCDAAEHIRASDQRVKRLRETVSLMRRDLAALAVYGEQIRPDLTIWDAFADKAALTARALRRKLSEDELLSLQQAFQLALTKAREILEPAEADETGTSDAENEQHHQNSQKEIKDSEQETETKEKQKIRQLVSVTNHRVPNLPLALVLSACPELRTYSGGEIRHWHELVRTADLLRPMMGISPSAWEEAKRAMGPEEASVVLAAMLERFSTIKNPGGYLRCLSGKAATGVFSCSPMIMALLRREAA